MNPENGGFESVADIVDGGGARDINRVGSAPLVRPRNRNRLGRGLCRTGCLLATVGKFAGGPSELWRGQRLES